jgi:autotransporter-associated beta strand protein
VVLYFVNGFTATGSGQNLTFGGGGLLSCDGSIATGNGSVTYDGTYSAARSGLSLGSANSFTGGVFINSISGGFLRALAAGALGPDDSATVTFGPGTTGRLMLESPTQTQTIVGLNSNAGNPGTPVISPGTGYPYRLAQTLVVSNATANTYAGKLADAETSNYKLSLTKGAAGTLTLSGNNTYTGTTTINGGMLLAGHANALGTAGTITVNTNGTLGIASGVTFSRAVTFNAGSGLAGSGTFVTNAVWTVPANFRLTPGLSTNVIGTLTVDTANNALTAASGTRLEIDFTADGSADKLVVAGTGSLNLSTAGDTLVLKGTIKVGTYVVASANSVSGQFDAVDKTALDAASVSVSYPGDGTVVVTALGTGTTVLIK